MNYRKKVFDLCKANNLIILDAGPHSLEIDYPKHIRCVANNWHSLYYPDLSSNEVRMPEAWSGAWDDLKQGVEVCPEDCDCRYSCPEGCKGDCEDNLE